MTPVRASCRSRSLAPLAPAPFLSFTIRHTSAPSTSYSECGIAMRMGLSFLTAGMRFSATCEPCGGEG